MLNALCTDCKTPCAKNPHTGHCFRGVGESLKLIVETDKVPLTVFIPYLKPAAGAFMHTGRSCCGLASLQPSSAPASVHLKGCRKCFGEKQTCLTLQPNWQGFSAGATAMLLHPYLAHLCCCWPLTPCRPPNPSNHKPNTFTFIETNQSSGDILMSGGWCFLPLPCPAEVWPYLLCLLQSRSWHLWPPRLCSL